MIHLLCLYIFKIRRNLIDEGLFLSHTILKSFNWEETLKIIYVRTSSFTNDYNAYLKISNSTLIRDLREYIPICVGSFLSIQITCVYTT